ncbi:hypothetical protein [Psychromonas sp. SP041]|uniref:hypothetical protein n=1 Tax=Psychromonas sp. SP041 TaxID=1365007 RepID=UPI0010C79482|nr:hypothetical protein [Psychromonas sp. SP041]
MSNTEDIASVEISRDDILNRRVKRVYLLLQNHKGTPNNKLQIVVSGYDNVTEELYQIKEVRYFFKKLLKRFNNILSPTISSESIYIALMCMIPTKGTVTSEEMGFEQTRAIMRLSDKSIYGKELSSHIAISALSKYGNGVGVLNIAAKNKEDDFIQSLIEGQMDITLKLAMEKNIFIKVKNWNHNGNILICFYTGRTHRFKVIEETILREKMDDLHSHLSKIILDFLSKLEPYVN